MGQWIVILIQAHHGLGRHQDTLTEAELTIFNHASFWGNVIGIAIGTMFLKLSIAVNLLRICQNRWSTVVLWILIGSISASGRIGVVADMSGGVPVIVILYELVGTLFFFLNCRPMAGSWDLTIDAKCSSTRVIVIFGLINTSEFAPECFGVFI